jgi:hypothetical protein
MSSKGASTGAHCPVGGAAADTDDDGLSGDGVSGDDEQPAAVTATSNAVATRATGIDDFTVVEYAGLLRVARPQSAVAAAPSYCR